MKINELRSAQLAKPAAITEAVHQPQNGGGRIYDAISRNIGVISAAEKQDIISLLQSAGVKPTPAPRQQSASASSQSPEQVRKAKQAAAKAAAQSQMADPANQVKPAVWRYNRQPNKPAVAPAPVAPTPAPVAPVAPKTKKSSAPKTEPISIGGQKLNPADPADAKIIAQLRSRGAIAESQGTCPKCGGPAFTDLVLAEKKDACYNKVRSRYKVWPSAYASGALVQCRKKGAKNWGNKS